MVGKRVAVAQRDSGVCDKMGGASYHGLGGFYSKGGGSKDFLVNG